MVELEEDEDEDEEVVVDEGSRTVPEVESRTKFRTCDCVHDVSG